MTAPAAAAPPRPRPRRRHRRRHHRHLGRLSPRAPRGGRRGAAGTRPADLGHHLARGRAHGHLRLDLADLDRAADVHPGPVRPAGGGDRARDRPETVRADRARHRAGAAGGVPAGRRVQPAVRRGGARDLAARGRRPVPAGAGGRRAGRLLHPGRRPGEPGRRDDVAGPGRPDAGRADHRGRAGHRFHASNGGAVAGVRTPRGRHRGRVRRQLRRDVGPRTRRAGRGDHPAAGRRALLPADRADRGGGRRTGRCWRTPPATATTGRRAAG